MPASRAWCFGCWQRGGERPPARHRAGLPVPPQGDLLICGAAGSCSGDPVVFWRAFLDISHSAERSAARMGFSGLLHLGLWCLPVTLFIGRLIV